MKIKLLIVCAALVVVAPVVFASEGANTITTTITATATSGGNSVVSGVGIMPPAASPDAGMYSGSQTVTLSASGATNIRYTTDGTIPTCSTGTPYTGPIMVSASEDLKVVACYAGGSASAPTTFAYVINGASSGNGSSVSGTVPIPGRTSTSTIFAFPSASSTLAGLQFPAGQGMGVFANNFSRDLRSGMTGDDVRLLQVFLNQHGFVLAKRGAGSPGNETKLFGSLTSQALVKFQKSMKLKATGKLDLTTRTVIDRMP